MSWKRRILAGLGTAAAGASLLLTALVGGAWYAVENPWVICRALEWGLEWPEGSFVIEELDIGWDGRFTLHNVEIHPLPRQAPDLLFNSLAADIPNPWAVYSGIVNFGVIEASGVRVATRMQQPPVSRPPTDKRALTIVASELILVDGSFFAPEDEPFKEVDVRGVQAHLTDITWVPATKRIDAFGSANLASMALGSIDIEEVELPMLVLAHGNLLLGESSFRYGRTKGTVEGLIEGIDKRPKVTLTVRLGGSRIETAVEDAMGRQSPIMGWLSAELTIYAGGDLERGNSRFDGWIQLSEAYVFMGNNLKLIPRLLLDVAPWFQRENGGWLKVGNLRGEAQFGRGWVELERMERESNKHRILQAWGSIKNGSVDLTVRAVPKKDPEKRGIGVRVRGPLNSAKIKLAKKGDLIDAPRITVID